MNKKRLKVNKIYGDGIPLSTAKKLILNYSEYDALVRGLIDFMTVAQELKISPGETSKIIEDLKNEIFQKIWNIFRGGKICDNE